MNPKNFDFAILGGDMRQVYMVNDLINRNYTVISYGLKDSLLDSSCVRAESLSETIHHSSNIIAPIPVTKDGVHIICQESKEDLTMENLCNLLTSDHRLYGGCLTSIIKLHCTGNGIYYNDLMENEEIILFNTIATAEGIIAEAICNSTINLHGSNCLIIGYGKCARTLSEKLRPLCGSLDIAARSPLALSAANASSLGTVQLASLGDTIHKYDYIFNTVPALVLPKELLQNTKSDITILDIASNPGGVDYAASRELNRNSRLCLGLPGKYSPKSSAVFLNNYILSDLRK